MKNNKPTIYTPKSLQIVNQQVGMANKLLAELKAIGNNFDKHNEIEELQIKKLETNIYGFSLDWSMKSREFRKSKNYTCENCGVSAPVNVKGKYIHTHHIDWNKSNNDETNLRCFCILCHFNIDEVHRKKMINSVDLKEYIKEYRSEIKRCFLEAIPALNNYDKLNK